MTRPIGVTMLAIGAGLIGIYELYRTLIFMGIASFNFGIGKTLEFNEPQWGQVFWSAGPRRDLVLGGQGLLAAPRVRLLVRRVHRASSRSSGASSRRSAARQSRPRPSPGSWPS